MAGARLIQVARRLSVSLGTLQFSPPVRYVYNPLDYARRPHELYLKRYGGAPKEVVFLGMNPGPWGMAQTGVPFGEVEAARDWLEIEAPVGKPQVEHPKRTIQGFDCRRSEVSGRRLWGWARDRFSEPRHFFSRFFVANYCPLCFLEETGRNRTPDRLPAAERMPLLDLCDRALREVVEILEPSWVVGVGRFAERRARESLRGLDVQVGRVLHPSPASPAANRGWRRQMERELQELGIELGGRVAVAE